MTRFHTTITERGSFRSCRRRWYLDVVERLAHKDKVAWPLIFGDAIHKGLEGYYTDNSRNVQDALDWFEMHWRDERDRLVEHFGGLFDMGIGEEWQSYLDKGKTMLTYYDIYDKANPFWSRVLEVNIEERSFIEIIEPATGIPYHSSPLLSGRIDLVVERDDGIWIVDHKTAANAYTARALDVDDQLTGYAYIYWRLTGVVPRGVIYNALIKEPPGPPRILKDGSISKDKSQRTTYDLYLEAIKQNGLDRADYTEILEILHDKGWNQFFVRDGLQKNIEELESFEERLSMEYEDMSQVLAQPERAYPNPSQQNCPGCSYIALCQSMEEKGDVDYLREEMYEVIPPRTTIPEGV